MTRQNVSHNEIKAVCQLSLFPDQASQSEPPTGGPSALEKAIWALQWCHVMHQVFFYGGFSEEGMLTRLRYQREWSRLFDWGTEHGYPEHYIRMDGRVVSVIARGRNAWLTFCTLRDFDDLLARCAMHEPPSYPFGKLMPARRVDVSLDRDIREEVMELGQKRGWWNYLMYASIPDYDHRFPLSIDGGEENWRLFARYGDIAYVAQMRLKLQHQAIRDALYDRAGEAGWPQFSYARSSAWTVKLGGEPSWRHFCAQMGHEDFSHVYENLFWKGVVI